MLEKAQSISGEGRERRARSRRRFPGLSFLFRRGFKSTIFDPSKVELHRDTNVRAFMCRVGSV